MNAVEYIKGGSDPEFSFALTDQHGRAYILGADQVVGGEREVRLKSFIGTDGHANTAELRPPPCHNVYWHMIKIADALKVVKRGLEEETNKRQRPVVAVAQPSMGANETMGGHIWISMKYHSPLSARIVNKFGRIYSPEHRDLLNSHMYVPYTKLSSKLSGETLQQYLDLAREDKELTVDLPWRKLHYLIWPLECTLFGVGRTDRAVGVRDKFYRLPDVASGMDKSYFNDDSAYFRFEYRIPTTWLSHPTLAYGYLGLAKLAMLNYYLLPDRPRLHEAEVNMKDTQASNYEKWGVELLKRVDTLLSNKHVKVTRDLQPLRDALGVLVKTRLRYPCLINFEAWAGLKPQRG